MVREHSKNGAPGLPLVVLAILWGGALVWIFYLGGQAAGRREEPLATILLWTAVAMVVVEILCIRGFFIVAPNEAKVLQLFGDYAGSAKIAGLRWANPFFTRKKISLRVRNFESSHLKVNDAEGNPIEIAAVVVWRVVETAEAMFEVDDYENYVRVQSEAALRNAATSYPYDSHEEHVVSLRGSTAVVADHLKQEVQQRLLKAGVEVLEARISHLRTHRKSRQPCFSGSRRAPSSRRVSALSRAQWGWWRWRWPCSPPRTSFTWTMSGRPRW